MRWSLALGLLVSVSSAAAAEPDRQPPKARLALVQEAFDRMFNYPSVRTIELHIQRNGRRVSYRTFDVAYRRLGDRGHTVLRFTAPDYLRGNAFLVIEEEGRSDAWLYQPEGRLLRRIGTQQKGDPFYGSDLSFEDLEHHDWSRFEFEREEFGTQEGRDCVVVSAKPPSDSQYERIVVYVEKARGAVLRVDFFRRGRSEPFKQMLISAARIEEIDGKLVPRETEVVQNGRDASTRIEMTRIVADVELTEREFSLLRLRKSGEDLFDMALRRSRAESEEQR